MQHDRSLKLAALAIRSFWSAIISTRKLQNKRNRSTLSDQLRWCSSSHPKQGTNPNRSCQCVNGWLNEATSSSRSGADSLTSIARQLESSLNSSLLSNEGTRDSYWEGSAAQSEVAWTKTTAMYCLDCGTGSHENRIRRSLIRHNPRNWPGKSSTRSNVFHLCGALPNMADPFAFWLWTAVVSAAHSRQLFWHDGHKCSIRKTEASNSPGTLT